MTFQLVLQALVVVFALIGCAALFMFAIGVLCYFVFFVFSLYLMLYDFLMKDR